MLGALLGGLVTAPLKVAAVAVRASGEAVQQGARDIPVLNAVGGSLAEFGNIMGDGARGIHDGISNFTLGGVGVNIADLGRGFSWNLGASSLTPGNVQVSQSLSQPVQAAGLATPFCVTMDDVTAPTVGCKAAPIGGPALFT